MEGQIRKVSKEEEDNGGGVQWSPSSHQQILVGTLQNRYIQNVPLPRVAPRVQSASHVMSHVTSHGADQLLVPCSHVMIHVTSHGADQLLVPCSHVMSHVTSYGADHLLVPCGLV
jgi:hypothetical protein